MTRAEWEELTLEEAIDWAYDNTNEITSEETLLAFAKQKIDDENIYMALHILNAIYDSTEAYNGYYLYDYSMGTLFTPRPITCKEDLEAYIDFDAEDDQ